MFYSFCLSVGGWFYFWPQFVTILPPAAALYGDETISLLQVSSLMTENMDLVTCLEWTSKQQSSSIQRSSSVQQEVLAVEQVRKV